MPYDAGTMDNQTNQKDKTISDKSAERHIPSAHKPMNTNSDSKDDIGWREELKKVGTNEDEKHDEEKSLLDPDIDDEMYSKDQPKILENDTEMRRRSTKPGKPNVEEKSKSPSSLKSKADSDSIVPVQTE